MGPCDTSRPKTARMSAGLRASLVLVWAVVGIAVLQAAVAVLWDYNWVWTTLMWTMLLLILVQVGLLVAVILRRRNRARVKAAAAAAEQQRRRHEQVSEWLASTFPRKEEDENGAA